MFCDLCELERADRGWGVDKKCDLLVFCIGGPEESLLEFAGSHFSREGRHALLQAEESCQDQESEKDHEVVVIHKRYCSTEPTRPGGLLRGPEARRTHEDRR